MTRFAKANTRNRGLKRRWYAVRMLFESRHPQERVGMRVFEDRIVLFKAASEREARRKARRYGRDNRQEYKNVYGKKVVWVFKEILDVAELFDGIVKEGTEVYWHFLNKSRLGLIRRTLKQFGE